jgi:hypothetical protein
MADREISMATSIKRGERVAKPNFALLHKTQMIGRKHLLEKIKNDSESYLQQLREANPDLDINQRPKPQKIIESMWVNPDRDLPDLVYSASEMTKDIENNNYKDAQLRPEFELPELHKLIPQGVCNAKIAYEKLLQIKDLGFETMGMAISIAGLYYGIKNGWTPRYLEIPGAIGIIMATSAVAKLNKDNDLKNENITKYTKRGETHMLKLLNEENQLNGHTLVDNWLQDMGPTERETRASSTANHRPDPNSELSGLEAGGYNPELYTAGYTTPETQSPNALNLEMTPDDRLWISKQLPLLKESPGDIGSVHIPGYKSGISRGSTLDSSGTTEFISAIEENFIEDCTENQDTGSTYWMEECMFMDKSQTQTIDADELEFPVYHERPHIIVTCPGGVKIKALIDLGATSSSIGPNTVEKIEENMEHKLPRLRQKYTIYTYGGGIISNVTGIVMNILIGDKVLLKRVPFMVQQSSTEMLISSAIIMYKRISMIFELERCLLKFYVPEDVDIEVLIDKVDKSIAYLAEEIQLHPGQEVMAKITNSLGFNPNDPTSTKETQIRTNNWINRDVLLVTDELYQPDQVQGSISTMNKDGHCRMLISNKETFPMTLPEGSEIGSATRIKEGDGQRIVNYTDNYITRQKFEKIKKLPDMCYCRMEASGSYIMVQFSDYFGSTHTTINYSDKLTSLTSIRPGHLTRKGPDLWIRSNMKESYEDITEGKVRQLAKANDYQNKCVVIVVPKMSYLTGEQKRILTHFDEYMPKFRILYLNKVCWTCDTPALTFLEPMSKGLELTKIVYFTDRKDTFECFYKRNSGYDIFKYKYEGSGIMMFRQDHMVIVAVHVFQIKNNDHEYIMMITHTIINWLRLKGFPDHMVFQYPSENKREILELAVHQAIMYQGTFRTQDPYEKEYPTAKLMFFKDRPHQCSCYLCCQIEYHGKESVKIENLCTIYEGKLGLHRERQFTFTCSEYDMNQRVMEEQMETHIEEINRITDNPTDMEKPYLDLDDTLLDSKVYQELTRHPGALPDEEDIRASNYAPPKWDEYINVLDYPENIRKRLTECMDNNQIWCADAMMFRAFTGVPLVSLKTFNDEKPRGKPIYQSPSKTKEIDRKLEMLLQNKLAFIGTGQDSDYGHSPIFTVAYAKQEHKPPMDRKMRQLIDLRELNRLIVNQANDAWLPRVQNVWPTISNAIILSLCDMHRGFRAMTLDEESQKLTSFQNTSPSSRFKGLNFVSKQCLEGCSQYPSLFQQTVLSSLSPKTRKTAIVYIDDILVFLDRTHPGPPNDQDYADHMEQLNELWQDLYKINALLSLPKLQLFKTNLVILGHNVKITDNNVEISIIDKQKEYFRTMEIPKSKKELQSLLGVANWISKYIPSYATLIMPLISALTGRNTKTTKFALNEEQIKSINSLRLIIDQAPGLTLPRLDKPMYVQSDSSLVATAGFLYQLNDEKEVIPISYCSNRFPLPIILTYNSIHKECLSIIYCTTFWQSWLRNCKEVILQVDLQIIMSMLAHTVIPGSGLLSRISHKLYSLPYQWTLKHIPSQNLAIADGLSRIHKPDEMLEAIYRLTPELQDFYDGKITIPEDWKKDNKVLTTRDIMNQIYKNLLQTLPLSEKLLKQRFENLSSHWYDMLQESGPSHPDIPDIDEQSTIIIQNFLGGDNTSDIASILNEEEMPDEPIPIVGKEEEEMNHIEELCWTPQEKMRQLQYSLSEERRCEGSLLYKIENSPKIDEVSIKISSLVRGISRKLILKLQREDEYTKYITKLILLREKKDIPKSIIKRYRLLDGAMLCARKTLTLPFSFESNLKISLNTTGCLEVMARMHLSRNHLGLTGLNELYKQNFWTKYSHQIATVLANTCARCALTTASNEKFLEKGRFARPPYAGHTYSIDVGYWREDMKPSETGHKMLLVGVDLFSMFIFAIPMKQNNHETIINTLTEMFSYFGAPIVLRSDNERTLLRHDAVRQVCRNYRIDYVHTSSAYHSKSQSLVEFSISLLRRAMALNKLTYKRPLKDIFHQTMFALNQRPLLGFKHLDPRGKIPTPALLHWGFDNGVAAGDDLLGGLSDDQIDSNIIKWRSLLGEWEQTLQALHDEMLRNSRLPTELKKGQLVFKLNTGNPGDKKHQTRWTRDIYEIITVGQRKVEIRPLFSKPVSIRVNAEHVKTYKFNKILETLPEELINLLGKVHSEVEIKRRAKLGEELSQFSGSIRRMNKVSLRPLRGRLMPTEEEEGSDEESNLSDISTAEDDSESDDIQLKALDKEDELQLEIDNLFPKEKDQDRNDYYKELLYGEVKQKIQPPLKIDDEKSQGKLPTNIPVEPRKQSGRPQAPVFDRRYLRIEPKGFDQLRREKPPETSQFVPKDISTPERIKINRENQINASPVAIKYPGSYRNTEASMRANIDDKEDVTRRTILATGESEKVNQTPEQMMTKIPQRDIEELTDNIARKLSLGGNPKPKNRPESIYQVEINNNLKGATRDKIAPQELDEKRPESIKGIVQEDEPVYQNNEALKERNKLHKDTEEHVYEEIKKPQGAIPKSHPQKHIFKGTPSKDTDSQGSNSPKISDTVRSRSTKTESWNVNDEILEDDSNIPDFDNPEEKVQLTTMEYLQENIKTLKQKNKFPIWVGKSTDKLKTESYNWVDTAKLNDPELKRAATKDELQALGYKFPFEKVGKVTLLMALKSAKQYRKTEAKKDKPPLVPTRRGTRRRIKTKPLIQEM